MTKRILIIDDEDDIREVAQVALELLGGWDILTACSGSQGLVQARSEQPDAILLDVMMPDMDGPTTFRKLQADRGTRHIPVILLTAKVQAIDRSHFEEMGVTAMIAKPFDPLELPTQVADALGWER